MIEPLKIIGLTFICFSFLSSNASGKLRIDNTLASSVVSYYFQQNPVEKDKPSFVSGDFNSDGYTDTAVLIKPAKNIKNKVKFTVIEPWRKSGGKIANRYHTSLAIIHGSANGFKNSKAKVFVLLDSTGVLETPSFELIVKKQTEKDFKEHSALLPIKTKSDFLILPTEAGIDTYVYWDKNTYKLYEPEEEP